jgi:hypothetical protein
VALIDVEVPAAGRTTVRGRSGAVEARSTVVLENLNAGARTGSPVLVEARASVDGAFAAQIDAAIGDELSVLARDDAGNRGASVRLPAGPNPATFQLLGVSGSGQAGVTGRPLTEAFRVRVRGGVPAVDLRDVEVRFEIVSGGGSLSRSSARTDAQGLAETSLTLGAAEGPAQVRARIAGQTQEVLFNATATGAPQIVSLSPTEGDRGAVVTVVGRNFSPIAAHNVTEFNGVQADVQSAAVDRLTVTVPSFAFDGPVTVTLTGARSNGLAFKVNGPPPALPSVGSVQTTRLTGGPSGLATELRLGFLTGAEEYVVAVEALSTSSALTFGHSVAGDAAALPEAGERPSQPGGQAAARGQALLDAVLRAREAELAALVKGKPRPAPARLSQAEPEVGERRDFKVINTLDPNASVTDPRNFNTVQTVLRYKGAETLVYVDERVPALDLTDADIRRVGDRFDTQTYVTDRAAFGSESDIDGDGRVTILLSATVNELNRGALPEAGIVIGFFFGLDLLPSFSPNTSNGRELFYGFVPDPSGQFGPRVSREFALATLDEVFAHELQHMISFNEHVLVRNGQSEDLWLNEGLSHIAENLNGFNDGNDVRAAFYLKDTSATGLALAGGGNSLSERGAAFLFLRHLADQRGEGVFRQLVQTRDTGVGNVQNVTFQSFANLFADWFAALFLDDSGFGSDPRYQIPSLTVKATYDQVRALNPSLGLGPYLNVKGLLVPGGNLSTTTVGTAGTFYTVATTAGPNERRVRISAPGSSDSQVSVIRTR